MFCRNCGAQIDDTTNECVNCGARFINTKKLSLKLCIVFLVISLISVSSYAIYNYANAVNAKDAQNFIEAQAYYDNLLIADKLFPDDYAYVKAGVLMDKNADIQALNAFKRLDGCNIPHSIIETLKEEIYSSGQWYYHRQNYTLALQYFEAIGEYRRSEDYLLLSRCHIEGADDLDYSDFTRLLSLLDFEDTGIILLRTSKIASRFLEGRWENNGTYFRVDRSPSSISAQFDLPHEGIQECASIEYGVYCTRIPMGEGVSYAEHRKSEKKHFEIQIIDKDTIRIYCYKDNSVYILYRQ